MMQPFKLDEKIKNSASYPTDDTNNLYDSSSRLNYYGPNFQTITSKISSQETSGSEEIYSFPDDIEQPNQLINPDCSQQKNNNSESTRSEVIENNNSDRDNHTSSQIVNRDDNHKSDDLSNNKSDNTSDNNLSNNNLSNNNLSNNNLELASGSSNGINDISIQNNQEGFLAVFKNRNFLALWSGQVFSQLADKVYLVLMIALINANFQSGSGTISGWVSALMMAFTLPAIFFGSLAGVFVDRWSKKTVLVATNILRGALVFVLPPLLWLTHDWQSFKGIIPVSFAIILGITFLVSTLTQFFAPAEQAAIPLIVKEKDLLSANSLYTTTMMASVIVGFAVGEPLLGAVEHLWQKFGGVAGLGQEIVVGGGYAVAGLILLLLITNEKSHQTIEKPHIFADLKDGFIYIKANNRLRNALVRLIILFSVLAALTVLAVRMAEVIPNLKAEQFGFLLASGGVGVAVGAGILGQFGQRFAYARLSLYGCLGMAASLAGLSLFSQQLWIVLLLVTLLGAFGALVGIPMQTAIQTETPPEMRGKVFGLQNNLINIALSLPLALAGVAETFFGLRTVFLGLGAIVFVGGLLSSYSYYE
ncbi:MFS transporter [Mastigocoleus testarum]|uniref:MFS transporter n=1 Tax=Mastigocoleus testarum TaxID=996925 RepID=UPI000483207E|nr:MFS transporter [Mastigocoleus testarum]